MCAAHPTIKRDAATPAANRQHGIFRKWPCIRQKQPSFLPVWRSFAWEIARQYRKRVNVKPVGEIRWEKSRLLGGWHSGYGGCSAGYRIQKVGQERFCTKRFSNRYRSMGRPKSFNREGVLEKALPVFWRRGFADASLHELEVATGVNKSGLYSEFKDKEDLFMESLRYYLESLEKKGLLTAEPLGWKNIERFLKVGPCSMEGKKGCFAVSSMREFAILPPEAVGIITRSRNKLKQLIAKNIEVERPKRNADSLAELVLTFFTGLSMEHNLNSSRPSLNRKIDDLMNIVRTL